MAGRSSYIVANVEGTDSESVIKGGKVPTFATWVHYTETQPHPSKGAIGWVRVGWSYQANQADAAKKALPEFKKYGMQVTATRVLPASL